MIEDWGAPGLYEDLVTEALQRRLRELPDRLQPHVTPLRAADAADRIAWHLGQVIERAIAGVRDADRVAVGVTMAQQLVALIANMLEAEPAEDAPTDGSVLERILDRRPDGSLRSIESPLIPLLDTTLLTNAPGEPRVGSQILQEVDSADGIDVLMAFVRLTGVRPLLAHLRRHRERSRPLRLLTTTYTGSTEQAALEALVDLGAEVRVSYDTTTTRLHAKSWLFHRRSGFHTAYVGSSNLTHSAQVSGLEWNVRVSAARNPRVVAKIAAVFDSYWESGDFEPYDPDVFARAMERSDRGPSILLSPIELRLEPFQERLLEQVELSRQRGHHRNLLVAATGTGKTVMAAVDYARLRTRLPRARLLFLAHRDRILDQSLATFRHALRDASFGERWVGGDKPKRFDHVFASIQSLSAAGLRALDPGHFDVVVVDEFHHAAAPTYRALLDHVQPVELLGLTATPERSDGLPILHWFDERIAAELRVWDAIDQHRLVPFAYYGIHDGLDLRDVPWRRGRGYDADGLTNLYTGDDAWARRVVHQVAEHVSEPAEMRALGFCVSVEHARFMARHFNEAGLPARAVWADSSPDERRAALDDLARGRVSTLFSVDLFNEGVDVPTVDTLLMLRPTDSATLFLQQLGRGLRRSHGKSVCTVLDFVGMHRREFRMDRRFLALLGGSRKDLAHQIERGFPFLPAGCHLELDAVAADIVLRSIREAVPGRWTEKVDELRALRRAGHPLTLASYLDHTGMDLADVYAGNRAWSDLLDAAGAPVATRGPHETEFRRAIGRLLHVDDRARLNHWRNLLVAVTPPDPAAMSEEGRRLARMLVASVVGPVLAKTASLADGIGALWAHPQVRAELVEVADVLGDRIGHLTHALALPAVPLHVHARYTRLEILAAVGVGADAGARVPPWQTGVYWAPDASADLLAFTLDKTSGSFSPTTRYRDYAISRDLVHWESQSVTRADSPTGRRYQQHVALGTSILLFARLRADERAFWFLGPARYVKHEGERPMAITWRLEHPLPGDLFAGFAAAVA